MCMGNVGRMAQTVERDTTITGPRGGRFKRQVEIQRSPGSIDRSGPDQAARGNLRPAGAGSALAGSGGRRSAVRGRGRLVSAAGGGWRPAPAIGFGLLAAPMLNFSFGGGGGGSGRMGGGPRRARGPGGPGPGGPGGRTSAAARPGRPDDPAVQSFYSSNRKDAAYTLGSLDDPRAIPSLVHVLNTTLIKGRANRLGDRAGRDRRLGFRGRPGTLRDLRSQGRGPQSGDDRAGTLECQGQERRRRSRRRLRRPVPSPAPPATTDAVAVPRVASAGPRAAGDAQRAVARPGRSAAYRNRRRLPRRSRPDRRHASRQVACP